MAKPRKCLICGDQYVYCPSCNVGDPEKTWMFAFCSENCKDVFHVVNDYEYGHIDKEEAKELLSVLDTSEEFDKYTQKLVNEIFDRLPLVSEDDDMALENEDY